MAESVYSYSLVEVKKDNVFAIISRYRYPIYVVKVSDGTTLRPTDYTLSQLFDFVDSTNYLYYYIKTTITSE